jgi:hypothetical protein
MKNYRTVLIGLMCIVFSGEVTHAQNPYGFMILPEMVGVSPSVTRMPYYPKGAVDINVLPLTWMTPNTKRLNSRATLIMNLGIREGDPIRIDNFGVGTYSVIYFNKRVIMDEVASGPYIAPGLELTFSRDYLFDIFDIKALLEAGYSFPIEEMTITAGIKGGILYHSDISDIMMIREAVYPYFGINVTIGFWHLF